MEAGPLSDKLHEDGVCAVSLGRGNGEESIGDLALHHHGPELDPRQAVEALGDQRRRDVVRQVGHELRRARRGLRQVELHGIAEAQLDVRSACQPLGELRREGGIQLDRVDPRNTICEIPRQDAEARPDLEHDVVFGELRQAADDPEDVLVDQEVLPQPLLRAHRQCSPKAAVAFASICTASASGLAPRASASTATVWTTYAGSFVLPRTGCGARYGQSVSARINSVGTARAASRKSSAFAYVTFPANDTYQPRSTASASSAGDEKQCSTTVPSNHCRRTETRSS